MKQKNKNKRRTKLNLHTLTSEIAPSLKPDHPLRKSLRSLKIIHECIIDGMDIQRDLLDFLRARAERIILRSEVQALGNPNELSQALAALLKQGLLERVNDDLYAFTDGTNQEKVANATHYLAKNAPSNLLSASERDTSVSRYVRTLAKRHNVFYESTFADRWASSVTRLADDDVKSDATDDLLVALRRAGKLSPKDMTKLVISHHREARRV